MGAVLYRSDMVMPHSRLHSWLAAYFTLTLRIMHDDDSPFEKLEVYHLAMQLVDLVRRIMDQLPVGNADLRSHLGRSERSIRLDTTEGSGKRAPGHKASRYDTARASANECAAALAEVRLFDLADRRLIAQADSLLRRITRMLTRLIQRWTAE